MLGPILLWRNTLEEKDPHVVEEEVYDDSNVEDAAEDKPKEIALVLIERHSALLFVLITL